MGGFDLKKSGASGVWLHEGNRVFDEEVALQKRFVFPETGITVLRLTSDPCVNHHIYPEAQVNTPDGKRFIFARRRALERTSTYWIGDIDTTWIRQITNEDNATCPVITPDGTSFYYSCGRRVIRLDPESFEREEVFAIPDGELEWVAGISSVDYTGTRFLTGARDQSGVYGVGIVDLVEKRAWMAYRSPDVRNPHGQYSRNADRKILVQVNNGIVLDEHENIIKLVGEKGASLMVVNDDGSNPILLKAGYTLTERVQGHQTWVGSKNMVITTMHRRVDVVEPWIQDRIVTVVPGEEYRIVGAGKGFTHIGTSPDGEWWVSDCNATADIFVGSVRTGKYRLFYRSGSTFGSAQEAHPHPFFLGDGKSVGWNSDVTGVPHIYCARIPENFLDELQ